MSLPDFTALNERRAEAGESTFMNPRNSAAGTIRQLDPTLTPPSGRCRSGATRSASPRASRFDAHWEALQWLREHGFRVNPDIKLLARRGRGDRAVPGVGASAAASSTSRSTASSSRSTTSSCSAGSASVGRDPRWAVAWKFPPTTAVTRLEQVMWNVGQVRRPAPVRGARAGRRRRRDDQARDAAQRGGPRAQGHPRGRGRDRAARRRRDPAGRLAGAARGRARTTPAAAAPARSAARSATRRRSSPRTRCSPSAPTATVPGRRWQLLKHFVSRGAMDIDGLGEKQVALLQERGLRRGRAADFYRLTAEQLARARAASARSPRASSLAAIEASKQRPFARVLFALGIEEVGEVTGAQPRPALPRHRRAARSVARGDRARRQGVGREDGALDPRAARTTSACAR